MQKKSTELDPALMPLSGVDIARGGAEWVCSRGKEVSMNFEREAEETGSLSEILYRCHGWREGYSQKEADAFFGKQMLPHLRKAAGTAEGIARRLRTEIGRIEGAMLDSPVWGQAKKPKGTQIY